jgi:hypothetical protein
MIPGETQFNSEPLISMNLGIGRRKFELNASAESSLSFMDYLLMGNSG